MSMLNKLKETQKNPVFLDDDEDIDIDNMDFPLPSEVNEAPARSSYVSPPAESSSSSIAVATGPQGVRRMDPSEYKDWVCVYPCYIDSDKSWKEGRKIAKEKAVKNPHAYHMALAVQQLGLSVVYEGKKHPRDWGNPGRVRVQIKAANNFYINQRITSRKDLFNAIAEKLPKVQKESELPKSILSPLARLSEVEAVVDEQRKAQGLPTLAEMNANMPSPTIPAKPKKQKIKYVRG
ncbi:signal recognition particle, SRP19 subunit [Radiomyces spectabilis]|uniref:signal recognition particle, SRP19 subunit n=1 Tax=Radiomyces spectabilis TaxID=64574 RepID=UPI00221F6F75|nr:signal recognition particle, SRP19 subunit [Radiomyces spectabilis]KAI8366630.1 signal recognition particle, SRP19 subunit [Radiomyces spectabilis]